MSIAGRVAVRPRVDGGTDVIGFQQSRAGFPLAEVGCEHDEFARILSAQCSVTHDGIDNVFYLLANPPTHDDTTAAVRAACSVTTVK